MDKPELPDSQTADKMDLHIHINSVEELLWKAQMTANLDAVLPEKGGRSLKGGFAGSGGGNMYDSRAFSWDTKRGVYQMMRFRNEGFENKW